MIEEKHLVSLFRSGPFDESFSDGLVCDSISGTESHNIAGVVPDLHHVLMRLHPGGSGFKVKSLLETLDIPAPGQRRRSSCGAYNTDSWCSYTVVLSTSGLSMVEIVRFLFSDAVESIKHFSFWITKINYIEVILLYLGSELAARHFLKMSARVLSLDPTSDLVRRCETRLVIEIVNSEVLRV